MLDRVGRKQKNYISRVFSLGIKFYDFYFKFSDLNPESYDAKMQFWIDSLNKWIQAKHIYKFKPSQVLEDFTANGRKPLCLQDVLLHLRESAKTISDIKDFKKSLEASWSAKFLKAGSYLFETILSPTSKEQKRKESLEMTFIHHDMLEIGAKKLLNSIKDMGLDNYCQKCDIEDLDTDPDLLLEYLRYQGNIGKFCIPLFCFKPFEKCKKV